MKFFSTKTYGTDNGLSCCFRQWRADHSHCSLLHGYAIGVHLEFESETLDDRNWVMDFGGLKEVKKFLTETFDHTTVIAEDDPELELFKTMNEAGVLDLRILPGVGCELFSVYVFEYVTLWLAENNPRVKLTKVEVFEHGANSAGVKAK